MADVYLGTSGFSFEDWQDTVYPSHLPKPQWLSYYEQRLGFNALELNYTYYQMPSHRTMQGLLRKTSPAFRFTIKTHHSLTHEAAAGERADNPAAFREFIEGMKPLAESGRLGCVLAQFPYRFANTPQARAYLDVAMDRLAGLPLVVEFRHKSWASPETFAHLRQRRVGWCAVDEPALSGLLPWRPEVTSEVGYARFHGRNAAQWFSTSTAERYNYLYNEAELQELAARVAQLAAPAMKTRFLYFNNCHAGSAAKNAQRFKELLVHQGLMAPASTPSLF